MTKQQREIEELVKMFQQERDELYAELTKDGKDYTVGLAQNLYVFHKLAQLTLMVQKIADTVWAEFKEVKK